MSHPRVAPVETEQKHMRSKASEVERMAAIEKVHRATQLAPTIRRDLDRILESEPFRGSRRSKEFLRFIVENALREQFDALRERNIGVELFGREPAWDTGSDAIVRVAANEVRRRLAEYYSRPHPDARVTVNLPQGSYIPVLHTGELEQDKVASDPPSCLEVHASFCANPPALLSPPRRAWHSSKMPWIVAAIGLASTLWIGLEHRALMSVQKPSARTPAPPVLPWKAVFTPDRSTQIIVADGNRGLAARELGSLPVPLADYAEGRYFNPPIPPTPETEARAMRLFVGIRLTSMADVAAATRVAQIAPDWARIVPRFARDVRTEDLKSGDNFLVIGSAAANPWASIADDQLRFSVEVASAGRGQVCRDKQSPSTIYVPKRAEKGTWETCAVVAFVPNPWNSSHIILLAGAGVEGTTAASEFVTDLVLLSQALETMGVDSDRPVRHFEMLLKLSAVSDSPIRSQVLASRVLPDRRPKVN